MSQISIQELTHEAFSPYGSFSHMINPQAPKLGEAPIEFFRDMVLLDLGLAHSAAFSVCRVHRRPLRIDVTEHHDLCGEGILPLDQDVLIHVAVATAKGEIPFEKMEVFRVPKGTFVSLRPGIWHHAPFSHTAEVANVLIVLPERTYAKDCIVEQIPPARQITIAPS